MKHRYFFLLVISVCVNLYTLSAQVDSTCPAPYIKCKDFVSINVPTSYVLQFYAPDLLDTLGENCMPGGALELSMIVASDDRGKFPLDCKGEPFSEYHGACVWSLNMQVWARNSAGKISKCSTTVLVQDILGNGNCYSEYRKYQGCIQTVAGMPFDSAELRFQYAPLVSDSLYVRTNPEGYYSLWQAVDTSTGTPAFDYQDLNGISSFDLLLLSRHILNVSPIQNPYALIAADANRSGTLTTFDIVELRKLVLGVYTALPHNTSWRFVDADYVFPNPLNPFAEVFPEGFNTPGLTRNDFIAIKIGDLNLSALPPGQLLAPEDRDAPVLPIAVADRPVAAGEVFEVNITTPAEAEALQFSLEHYGLELLSVSPEAPYTNEHFAVFSEKATLTAAFDLGVPAAFTLRFRAQHDGFLHEMLQCSDAITRSEAVVQQKVHKPVLQFESAGDFSIAPNPSAGQSTIAFRLENPERVRLRVYDALGRSIWEHSESYPAGAHQVLLDLGGQKGVFYVLKNEVMRQVVVVP